MSCGQYKLFIAKQTYATAFPTSILPETIDNFSKIMSKYYKLAQTKTAFTLLTKKDNIVQAIIRCIRKILYTMTFCQKTEVQTYGSLLFQR